MKNRVFYRFLLSAKFNRFFIILGGGIKTPFFHEFCLHAKFNRFFIILGRGRQKDQKSRFLVILGVPYTGILGKKPRKSLIPHHHFLMIFRFGIYGGLDPIYGDFDKNRSKTQFLVIFYRILLCAKFNRFFIILGGGGYDDREGLGIISYNYSYI